MLTFLWSSHVIHKDFVLSDSYSLKISFQGLLPFKTNIEVNSARSFESNAFPVILSHGFQFRPLIALTRRTLIFYV